MDRHDRHRARPQVVASIVSRLARRRVWIVSLGAILSVTLLSSSALAHDIVYLRDDVKVVVEGTQTNFSVARCCHGSGSARVDWTTRDGSAVAGTHYQADSGELQFPNPIPPDETITFRSTAADGVVEPVKRAHIELSNPRGSPAPIITSPKVADAVIVDVDGPSRVAFMLPEYSVYANREYVELDAVRLGTEASISGAETIGFTVGAGGDTAKRGVHYKAPDANSITFSGGERRTNKPIRIPLIRTFGETKNTELTVSLDVAPDVTAGPDEATVEIRNLQTGDYAKPFSSFHFPKHGATYSQGSYKTKEAHVYADDGIGSGVKIVKLALRKEMKGGSCKWWNGKRWKGATCKLGKAQRQTNVWGMQKKPRSQSGDVFTIFKYPKLKPTQGTNVRNYTVISKATDFSANPESLFTKGDNLRTFKIRR